MKILIVNRSVAHFSYFESLYYELHDRGHKLLFIFEKHGKKIRFDKSFTTYFEVNKDCAYEWMTIRQDEWRKKLFFLRELLTYSSYLNRNNQSSFYIKRWLSYQPRNLQLLLKILPPINILLKSNFCQNKIREFESETPPDKQILDWVKSKNPDVIVASPVNMRFSEEIEYIKAAKSLGIPTFVPVYSWDNLTTKGLFHIAPTYLLVWSEQQHAEAVEIHKIPNKNIKILGALFFDKWIGSESFEIKRSKSLRNMGLNENDEFLLYLGSSANIAKDETWLIKELMDRISSDYDPAINNLKIIVKPHPANTQQYHSLDHKDIIVISEDGVLPESFKAKQEFYNAVKHSVCTIAVNTSAMIDAILIGKPCLSILTEKYRSTQFEAVHFKHLYHSGALDIAQSVPDCVDLIKRIRDGNDTTKESRDYFVKKYIRPHGIHTKVSELAASFIENEFSKENHYR